MCTIDSSRHTVDLLSANMSSPSSSSRSGSHRGGSSSISALVSTLVPCIVVAGLLVGAFLILRVKLKRVYAPRTFHDALQDE